MKDNLYGDESVAFVAHGNATGEIIARIIIPLCDWLGLFWLVENPVSWHCQKQTLHGAGTLVQIVLATHWGPLVVYQLCVFKYAHIYI